MEIIFVTSNEGKFQSLAEVFPTEKYTLIQKSVAVPELQGNTAMDVSAEKAREAFKIVKKPLIIQDSAFHINALKGFPGPYIKYIQETIGLEGLLKLMEGVEDRSCYFEQAVTYIDETTIKTFVGDRYLGNLATRIATTEAKRAWGLIWKLFVPEAYDKTLSEMSEEDFNKFQHRDSKSEFVYFVEWLTNK